MSIASRSYQHGKKTVVFHGFPSLQMSRSLTADLGEELLTSYLADSRVRTYPLPGMAPELMVSVQDCGEKWRESSVRFDPVSSSWKTYQPCLSGEWELFSAAWSPAGMTRNGIAYRLASSAPTIPGLELSLSGAGVKYLTLTVNDANNSTLPPSQTHRNSLVGQLCRMGFVGQQLNPRWCEEMFGFPAGWTELPESETA
jgi:hypothetical protein